VARERRFTAQSRRPPTLCALRLREPDQAARPLTPLVARRCLHARLQASVLAPRGAACLSTGEPRGVPPRQDPACRHRVRVPALRIQSAFHRITPRHHDRVRFARVCVVLLARACLAPVRSTRARPSSSEIGCLGPGYPSSARFASRLSSRTTGRCYEPTSATDFTTRAPVDRSIPELTAVRPRRPRLRGGDRSLRAHEPRRQTTLRQSDPR
jgi:hypothetical protein